jgi:hypothetical protein
LKQEQVKERLAEAWVKDAKPGKAWSYTLKVPQEF